MRVFLAIDLSDTIRSELERLQEHLMVGRLVPSENLHLTLCFLGEQSDAVCEDVHEALAQVHAKPFDLRLAGLGTFGKKTPQAIFADVERCEELIELERKITRKLRGAGVQFQKRRFRPHITIAHLSKTLSAAGFAEVKSFLATQGNFQGSRFQIQEFHFYCSTLTPDQARHEILASYDLSNPEIDAVQRRLRDLNRLHFKRQMPSLDPTQTEFCTRVVKLCAPAPEVLAVDSGILVLEDLGNDTGLAGAWGSLGHAIRTLHARTGPRYGWPVDYQFGPVTIPNEMDDDWPRFWAERRMLAEARGIPTDLVRRIETQCNSLLDLLPASPGPSLLHGDLWVGNVAAHDERVQGLIDPACYYGHSEVDLAMLSLFGSPDETFWKGYGGSPEPGFEDRRAIYQLWPALVHMRLFGDGYRGLVERLLDRCSV